MRGELIGVWDKTWKDIWVKLSRQRCATTEFFSELYEGIIPAPVPPPEPLPPTVLGPDGEMIDPVEIAAREDYERSLSEFASRRAHYEEAVVGDSRARRWLRTDLPINIATEAQAISALERAFTKIEEIGGDELSNRYFNIVEGFIEKYSLRYDLRRPFSLHTTLQGIFSRLVGELKRVSGGDIALNEAMLAIEDAIRDLKNDRSSHRIKTCIAKQANFLEAIGQRAPGVNQNTLGRICDQVGTWPHARVKEAMKGLYGFASDYPGIRHGGTHANQLREIEMRDLVSISVLMFGFAPYLTDLLDAENVYAVLEEAA